MISKLQFVTFTISIENILHIENKNVMNFSLLNEEKKQRKGGCVVWYLIVKVE